MYLENILDYFPLFAFVLYIFINVIIFYIYFVDIRFISIIFNSVLSFLQSFAISHLHVNGNNLYKNAALTHSFLHPCQNFNDNVLFEPIFHLFTWPPLIAFCMYFVALLFTWREREIYFHQAPKEFS